MGSAREIRRKWDLLDRMDRNGIPVRVNAALHAKVYLFIDDRRPMSMIGSANLTGGGMEKHVELALVSHNHDLNRRVEAAVGRFLEMPTTKTFRRWVVDNAQMRP